MSVIERAARALMKAQSGDDGWDGLDDALQDQIRDEVRAVIEAIREPAEDMGLAGAQVLQGSGCAANDGAKAAWGAMIDTLLTTGGGATAGDG